MFDKIFEGVFDSHYSSLITFEDFLLCLGVALLLGVILAAAYAFKSRFTKSFLMTMATVPAIVCVIIMMVNGNIGAGVAVAGAFSLVRFRSVPGSAREIAAIFLAMGSGLVCGMGYLGFAALFTLILCLVLIIYNLIVYYTEDKPVKNKTVKITIPEDLDYTGAFDDVFAEFTVRHSLVRVKSLNMGSMFRLTYNVTLKDAKREKEFIDSLRVRNGNLEIMVSRVEEISGEL